MLQLVLWFSGGAVLSFILTNLYLLLQSKSVLQISGQTKQMLLQAEKDAAEIRRNAIEKAKEEIKRRKSDFELEYKKRKIDQEKIEILIQKKLDHARDLQHNLEREFKKVEEKSLILEDNLLALRLKQERVENSYEELIDQLEKMSHMTKKEAKESLFDLLRSEVELEKKQWFAKVEEECRLKAKEESIRILCTAMQRYVADQVTASSSGVIVLPNEDIKGKIIGKEGRNIKSLEMATGMEFVIGDSSETITISGFNPIRREIARKTLVTLLADGRINPTRIEEIAQKCESEVNLTIEEVGQQVVVELGFSGIHKDIIQLLGMLQFRTSYTQNVLEHCKETAHFARLIAEELGLNPKLAARCGLLHDIGKAISHEVEGPHAMVGAEFAKKCGENSIVVNAIAAHHEDVPPTSIYSIITILADTISASRIGARKETLSAYIKRVEQLEEIAKTFDGVKKAYALQAGREIRVIVDEVSIDDEACLLLARNMAKRIEQEMNFPGQIKINVIREKRCIEYAK